MQGRKNQVTCLCSLDRNICSFKVPDLTHHDYIRILAQEGSQRLRKTQADPVVYVDLIDAFEVNFGWVLSRGNIDICGV